MSSLVLDTWSVDADRVGIHRSIDPPGALPHIARVLDPAGPPNDYELELEVEMLAVDAASFAVIRERCHDDPERMASMIATIVADHGKLQNPWTGSGGVLMGRVVTVGPNHVATDLVPGELVVPLASLIAIPLALQAVGPVDAHSPHVPVRGRAIVTGSMPCRRVPEDLPPSLALAALDVYPAASHTRDLATAGAQVLVLGAGRAGLLATAAARAAVGAHGIVTAVDRTAAAIDRARAMDPEIRTLQADVSEPLDVARGLAEQGVRPADLTLLCTSVAGAEGAAILATAPRGTIVFFSTATRFAAAALGADAIGSQPRLLIPCGLTDDRGEYALHLLRTTPVLREAFGATYE